MHIVSVVVRTLPHKLSDITQQINDLAGTEIHAATQDGRMVATIEGASRQQISDTMFNIHNLKGVLSAALVYEHSEIDNLQLEAS